MIIVGSKYFGHDSAAYILDTEKRTIWALSTERATRAKHDEAPIAVMRELFPEGKIDILAHSFAAFGDIDLCFETKAHGAIQGMKDYVARELNKLPQGTDVQNTVPAKQFEQFASDLKEIAEGAEKNHFPHALTHEAAIEKLMRISMSDKLAPKAEIKFFEHHLCHAMSAYYSSPFYGKPSLMLSIDGQGDGYFGKAYIFRGAWHQEIGSFPVSIFQVNGRNHATSIGSLYCEFTAACGFRIHSDEGKVEALAAFGKPVPEMLQEMKDACIIAHNKIYFSPEKIKPYHDQANLRVLHDKYGRENFCATIQIFLEDTIVDYINKLEVPDDIDSLCLAGGVAANIIMNMNIWERTRFKKIHVTPYMGDEGTACGAAILAAKMHGINIDWLPSRIMPYFGPSYTREQVRTVLEKHKDKIKFTDLGDAWPEEAGQAVSAGKIIAIFQGQMEFGPRALGNRSILANPADPTIRERINVSIKRRPPWQPFCPSILESERPRLFDNSFEHKHMATAFRMNAEPAKAMPSAVHIDGTVRPQFVSAEDNPTYFRLLETVKKMTGYGVVINTSFNLHGRAMVMAPDHAIDDFLDCNLEELYIEGYRVTRQG